jgi:hypothetical protein
MKKINHYQFDIEGNEICLRNIKQIIENDFLTGKIPFICTSGQFLITGKSSNPFNTIVEGKIICSRCKSAANFIARNDTGEIAYKP